MGQFRAQFLYFCPFLVFMVAPERVMTLSGPLKGKRAVTPLKEKMPVLGEPHPGLSHSAVGHELSVNESTVDIK